MKIRSEKCVSCGWCVQDCPVGAITLNNKKAVIDPALCVSCMVCLRVCRYEAVEQEGKAPQATQCRHCPIQCAINPGNLGACQRYINNEGAIFRLDKPLTPKDVGAYTGEAMRHEIREPVVTAIGVGTTYPDCCPAPGIISDTRNGVEVVTVTTEVPLSYSSVLLKIDTDVNLGKEGAAVIFQGRTVGRLETEQYGSKMVHIGGVNTLTGGAAGFAAVRAMVAIANGHPVRLRIEDGARLEVQVGQAPLINGQKGSKMRVGCGSATTGIFASMLVTTADEVLVLDSHITGQLSKHVAGLSAGAKPTGVDIIFPMSTPGRYFGDHGEGWGGTSITDPASLIRSVDMQVAWPGMTILVTETTGQKGAMFAVQSDGSLSPMELTPKARESLEAISATCEPSLVSAMYLGGSGGSARAGVCRYPIKLTQAVHQSKVSVTVGGVPAYVMPGGGISFLVDVGKVKPGSFSWTPTPATICPLEYTMLRADYEAIGGHVEAMKPFVAGQPVIRNGHPEQQNT